VGANQRGRLGLYKADSRYGIGVSVKLKKGQDKGRVSGLVYSRRATKKSGGKVGSRSVREEQRLRWKAALDLYLT
jgi:hypothetical protein